MADHIAGEIDNCLSINLLTPSTVKVSPKFGGGKLVISGNYPLGGEVDLAVNIDRQPHVYKEYVLEFRVPVNTRLERVEVNGVQVACNTNKRGYTAIRRAWMPGDSVHIVLGYKLRADVRTGEGGRQWVSFSYGPLALAQRITDAEIPEPFAGMRLDTPEGRRALLANFVRSAADGIPRFTAGDAGVELIPYCFAGSDESGPRTYFLLSPEK